VVPSPQWHGRRGSSRRSIAKYAVLDSRVKLGVRCANKVCGGIGRAAGGGMKSENRRSRRWRDARKPQGVVIYSDSGGKGESQLNPILKCRETWFSVITL